MEGHGAPITAITGHGLFLWVTWVITLRSGVMGTLLITAGGSPRMKGELSGPVMRILIKGPLSITPFVN